MVNRGALCAVLCSCLAACGGSTNSGVTNGGAPTAGSGGGVAAGNGGSMSVSGGAGAGQGGSMPNTASGGASTAGTSGTGGSGADLLVDDFEDGDGIPKVSGGWYGYDDNPDGGKSTLTFTGAAAGAVAMNGVGYESQKSLEVSYTFDQGTLKYQPYVGLGVSIGSSASPLDCSGYVGVSYTYQGGAHRLNVETTDVADYDHFGVALPASATWKTVTLPFATLSQEGWGAKSAFDPKHVTNLAFAIRGTTGASAKLQVDNLKLVASIASGAPDMTIEQPAPPVATPLDSIEIENPLQAKAMQYLTRGYNLTNWLEQERFSGFTYDESFVKKLAEAGFRGLRLPVDFDLYVESANGEGEDLTLTVSDDLFEVLDAFDAWTKAHGLSLTIDYHQYSTLVQKSDPNSLATAVQLWGAVAKHFADNPREDLFLELLNEPELSFDADPTQDEWTALAERMIKAIRAEDTTHSLIFGDIGWYGIEKLASRAPLSDDNVIYAFHDYAPFIFTHQGATWANVGSTHDIPYPYSPERWSQYYADLGFNTAMESWILSDLRNYYRTGNRDALRNQIIMAKRWGIAHDVPVICNEFGAYDASSRLEDRARYYTDLIGIFDEIEIPWQHWFMVMDAQGQVIPEYRKAMGLDAQE
ncbi:MAG TPA: cellulase family glycosylhydrolase [Polyangiaceae bacterium]|nr:cellulase family glycosylhydrolase [Polyangiaceae bacterium]